eukprot:TRINITY_DN3194_c0_g1_i1.p1 TRINITY_DN3194_c0_g1~~TRINITY_DN3194_c0_g1_i1.p1  ORF type:complete len:545 (+),score=79.63 TRINITY_DN3194_c0_g1_i1:2-1636(+)
MSLLFFFFQAEDGIRDFCLSRGLGDVYKRQDYNVIKMIGKGSFAKVYLAKKKENDNLFAIKAFSKNTILEQKKGLKSLANEVSIMRQLQHKNVLKLYEMFETVHSLYLVMMLVTGGDLNQKIIDKSIRKYSEIQLIFRRMLEAINYIHKQNIMHRDLKLDNILILSEKEQLEPIIVDFGLSTHQGIDIESVLFKRCGTPGFVAPEVLNFKDNDTVLYNNKCDIFSLGAIFYCLLARKKPFSSKDCKQLIQLNKACKINFVIPELLNAPESAQALVKKMLVPSAEKRLSAEECLQHPFFLEVFEKESDLIYEQNQISLLKQQKHQLDQLFAQKLKKGNSNNNKEAENKQSLQQSTKEGETNDDEEQNVGDEKAGNGETNVPRVMNQTKKAPHLQNKINELQQQEENKMVHSAEHSKAPKQLTKIPLQSIAQGSFLYQNETIMKGNVNTVQSLAGTNFENTLGKGMPKKNDTSIYQIHFTKGQGLQGLSPEKKQEVEEQGEIEIDPDDYVPMITKSQTANLQKEIDQAKKMYNFGLMEIKSEEENQ